MSSDSVRIVELAHRLTNGDVSLQAPREHPGVVEAIGRALAGVLEPHAVDAVILWSDPHTTVLGHVVARELGVDLIHGYADQGILSLSSAPAPGCAVAVVDYDWPIQPGLVPLLTMLRRVVTVAAVASVLPTTLHVDDDDLAGATITTLADSYPPESESRR